MNRYQNRRRLLKVGLAAAAALLLGGHTPYKQWVVYRRKHLLIGCHKDDPRTYDLARRAVALLAEHLPAAKARVARAPDARRLASLLGTEQMDVATLGAADAAAMSQGTGAFTPYGPTALRLLMLLGDRLLVARADFPPRHAWLVTGALAATELASMPGPESGPESGKVPDAGTDHGLPWHPGSADFLRGRPEPVSESGND